MMILERINFDLKHFLKNSKRNDYYGFQIIKRDAEILSKEIDEFLKYKFEETKDN